MKKLMIAAAAAAMVGGVYAVDNPQVYDFTATLKTTSCSSNKSAKDVCGDTVYYRSQITQKLYGKFWGCDCDVIGCPDAANYGIDDVNQDGYMFWTSTKVPGAFHGADWQWSILQRLGKKGENVEGAFDLTLTDCDGDVVATLSGAGYGTAKIDCADPDGNYIKSMSGNIVGTWDASSDVIATGCAYCGGTANCEVFEFCDACGLSDNDMAVVFGSFTLKYNASNTKSVAKGNTITKIAFNKNAAVLAEMACIAADDDDDDEEESTADKLEKAYAAAKEAYEDAKDAYDAAVDAAKAVTTNDQVLAAAAKAAQTTAEASFKSVTEAEGDAYKAVSATGVDMDMAKAYAQAELILAQYEFAMNEANKYGTTAAYNTAKGNYDTYLAGGYKAATNNYAAAVARVTAGGSVAADNQKKIDAYNTAVATAVDDVKAYLEAVEAGNVWAGNYFTYDDSVQGTTAINGDLEKIEGTKDYALANDDSADKKTAMDAAEKKMDNAKIACQVAGGDCE